MNNNNLFGGQQTPSSNTFGQTSLFGQNAAAQPASTFGQPSVGQSAPMFGQASNSQSAVFGPNTSSQSSIFGQTNPPQTALAYGQTSGGLLAPTFGQGSSGLTAPVFGQAASGQSSSIFGSAPTFGQTTPASVFGVATSGQTPLLFGQASPGQSVPSFGQSTSQSAPAFGQGTSTQSNPAFGQGTSNQSTSVFGQATSGPSAPAFGQVSSGLSNPAFGQATTGQSGFPFGQTANNQSSTPFTQQPLGQTGSVFGLATTGQSSSLFGQATKTQSVSSFGQSGQTVPTFGQGTTNQSSIFGQTATSKSASPFAQAPSSQSTSLFAQATTNQSASFFTQPTTSQSSSPFRSNASVFGQATSTTSRQSEDGSNQGSQFGQQSSTSRFLFGQTPSSQTPLFGQNTAGQSFGQTGSPQTGQDGKSQISGFGQVNSGQSNFFSQSSSFQPAFGKQESGSIAEFGQPQPAQSSSAFGIVQSTQLSKAEATEKASVFGQPSNTGQTGSVFGATAQLSTSSSATDSKFPTSMAASPFSQVSSMSSSSEHSFKPPAHTTFKPILTGTSKSDETSASSFGMPTKNESKDQPIFGTPTTSSTSGNVNVFSLSSEKKSKGEAATSKPSFASVNSSFTSFTEEPRRDEGLKGVKRKEEHDRSPHRYDATSSGESSSDLHGEHPPIKRPGRLNRDLKGGANLLVRSLYDVVKSQMKPQYRKDAKKEDNISLQPKVTDTDSPSTSQSFGRNHSSVGLSQAEALKTSAPLSSQVAFSKSQLTTTSQTSSSRMVSFGGLNQQGSVRDHFSAGPSELASRRIRPLLEEGELPQEIAGISSKTAGGKGSHSDSTKQSGPVSPSELTVFFIRNLPNNLNKKNILRDFFMKYGKIQRLNCRISNKMACIQFSNHNSAAAAKKAAKKLSKDAVAFWQRKKPSPAKKKGAAAEQRDARQPEPESLSVSPVIKPLLRGLKGSPLKKPTFSKTLQFSVDNPDATAPSSDTAVPLPPSLLHLVGTVAETSEEKYRLLDQRDKILRQARVKRTGLDQAKVFVGTCPDMCPEKERYMRDTRNQLSIYEFSAGTDKLDHAAAIKEYSRSSADQEEPLPHELRPIPVLCMTMNYLVTYVMDQGEDNYRDWYDFIWNRTRGVRKDITQQHLCDPLTVSLIEKCTRFHIHCAYQLCEEPMSSFDPKINNENLTKCLQSLKEMYKDLQNRGQTCACESEFRGYSVLLNLNNGDILREVQQFPQSVRNSEEVKFAVQVFAALNSTNFVRFFRLVRSASYLSSCILHCYFPQIRRDAVRVLNVAYTISFQRPTLFPLESMIRFLFFQDAEEATDFLTAYGLSVSEGFVELNRAAFAEPMVPLQPKRCSYISVKRQCSMGEVVNGAPLPQFCMHIPVCSFDVYNKYTGSSSIYEPGVKILPEPPATEKPPSEDASVKLSVVPPPDAKEPCPVPAQAVFQPIMPSEPPTSPPKPRFSNQDVADVLDDILEDTVKQLSSPIIQKVTAYISAALGESSEVADQLLTEVVLNLSRKVAHEEVEAETERVKEEKRRKEEEARRIKERERLLSLESQSQCNLLINEVITENIRRISKEELRKAVQLDHNNRVLRCSEDVCDQHVGQFVDEEIFQIARKTLYEMQCCSKYIQRWREVLAARKKLRRQMRAFPAAPGSVGHGGTLKALIPSAIYDVQNLSKGIVNLGRAGKLSVSFTSCQQVREQLFHQMKVQHYFQELLCDAAWMPLELPSLIAQHLPTWKQCIFWKVVLALPEISDPDDPTSVLSEWLKAKFCWAGVRPEGDQEQQVQTLALYSSLESQGGCPVRVNVCVKVVHGPLTENDLEQVELQKQFLGTSAIVLLLPVQSDTDVYQIAALLQLKQVLQAKPFKPPPTLAILVPSSYTDPETVIEEELNISELVTTGLISDYNVFSIPDGVNDLKGTNMVSSAVRFLLSHSQHSLELRSLPFRQYIEDGVCSAFSNAFYLDTMERKKCGLPSQDPAAILDLYNDTIAFLADAVSPEQLTELSWPVTEFTSPGGSSLVPPTDWNSPGHLAWLKKAVLCFQLPQMDRPPQGAPWDPVCSMILDYVSQITQSPSALPLLLSEVELLLGRIKKQWFAKEGIAGLPPSVQEIPWDEIIALYINHKLRAWDPPLISDSKVKQEDLYVYFFEEDLKHFTYPDTWERARLSTHQNVLVTSNSPPKLSSQTSPTPHSFFVSSENDTQNVSRRPELSELTSNQAQLNRRLLAEKDEDERFNEKLQQLLVEEPLNASLCLPMYLPIPSLSDSLENSVIVPALQKSATYSTMYSPTKSDHIVRSPSLRPSVKDRIKELSMNLRGNRQKDIAFNLHLSTLLDVAKIEDRRSSSN